MKKMNYLVTTILVAGTALSAYSQEFKKVSLPKGIYSEAKSFERVNQKRVNDAFKGLKEIYAFDFTASRLRKQRTGFVFVCK